MLKIVDNNYDYNQTVFFKLKILLMKWQLQNNMYKPDKGKHLISWHTDVTPDLSQFSSKLGWRYHPFPKRAIRRLSNKHRDKYADTGRSRDIMQIDSELSIDWYSSDCNHSQIGLASGETSVRTGNWQMADNGGGDLRWRTMRTKTCTPLHRDCFSPDVATWAAEHIRNGPRVQFSY